MTNFKKLNTNIYSKSGPEITPDYVYWKKLGVPVLVKEFGAVDYIDFSPIEPYHFAVTCSFRVQIYNPITKLVVKNLSRFKEKAHGAVFRSDGRLLCAGDHEGIVRLFDVSSKNMLRLFKGHQGPVHRTHFIHNKPQISSFSDDKSVRVWDIPTEKNVLTFQEHTDYIRAGTLNPNLPDLILSGGYDGLVKMYDSRTEKAVLSVNHGCHIDSVISLPAGGIFLSAGGTSIKIWDAIAGGKLLGCLTQHHKPIMCMQLASDGKRLLSGGLDRHVKIYDVSTFKVVHTIDYPNGILSLGVSKNDDTVVAGLVDGLLCINRREDDDKVEKIEKKKVSHRYKSYTHHRTVDEVIEDKTPEKQSRHDVHLRKFEYSKALDSVMKPYVATKNPHITVGVIQELIRRKALGRVYKQKETKYILQLLRFFNKNITNYCFTRVLIAAVNIFVDTFQDELHTMPMEVIKYLNFLNKTIKEELELSERLTELSGGMNMLLSAADTTSSSSDLCELKNLTPSADAQKKIIYNV